MSRYRVSCDGTIKARPAEVYQVIADYREHHPHIVPRQYFRRLDVLEGGVGAGTRTRVEMRMLGTTLEFQQLVTEPEPGRVLVESEVDGPSVTTFTVDRAGDAGDWTHLTISTELSARSGLRGWLERIVSSAMLRHIYRRELACISDYVASRERGAR